jgi:hypothetical protein
MMSSEHEIFLKKKQNEIKHLLSDVEAALMQVDIGNNACFSSPDSRESIRKRLNLILKQFEEKS